MSVVERVISVNYRHQLHFTDRVFARDNPVLASVLVGGSSQSTAARVKVLLVLEEALAAARPELAPEMEAYFGAHSQNLQLVCPPVRVTGGEVVKNDWSRVVEILELIHRHHIDRHNYVVVMGGGALLDMVGLAAATAHRGVRLIRIPTTTLAQADSGIGVKNGVNLFQKKNWLGSFAVPWGVINDRTLLETLSDRDFRCGFSEAVKVSLLKDAAFFNRILRDAESIAARGPACWPVIQESAQWHLRHITTGGDPFEMLEARPLDYGHWSAHKLETMSNFELRHGEAVAIGVAVDTVYSSLVHRLPTEDADRVLMALEQLGLLFGHPALQQTNELFNGLEEFRQHLGGQLTITMLEAIGHPINVHDINWERMVEAIQIVVDRVQARSR